MRAFLDSVWSRLVEVFDPSLLGEGLANLIANLIVGAATFIAFFVVWRGFARFTRWTFRHTDRVDVTTQAFIETSVKYVVLTIGLVQGLKAAGVDTAAVIASLGIAGLTIGFAARDALSNLISGILIFWDRPFVIGDLVEVEGQYGRVERITLRSTRVVTPDGRMLAVPNTMVINTTVVSYTNFPHLRIEIAVTIGVSEDIGRVREILLGLVAEDDGVWMTEPAPEVVVKSLNDYNVEVELRAWLEEERGHVRSTFELRERVYNALSRAGVDMPFETLRIEPLALRDERSAA